MRHGTRAVQILLVAGALASPLVVSGCFHHANGPWMSVEEPRYEQWERATHRTHQAYPLRGDDEQKEYWQWRQSHS